MWVVHKGVRDMFIDLIPDCESNGLGSWWWDHLEEAY